jgi:hypothetical protein
VQGVGWRHFQTPTDGVLSRVDVSAAAAHTGKSGVALSAVPVDPERPPAAIESPPVWIVTPPLPVEAGQLLRIHGWVRIPEAIAGSVDGLMIFDSISGPALADRIGHTRGWREFLLYRLMPRSGQMTVSFVLTGLGEARLDDVTVRTLEPAAGGGIARPPNAVRARR